ncbi:MAG: hypothetical protein OXT65_03255 [Alphaproteobacteria bacterium]|nr:hypothetical protein [Alphaproteobacteria bacterium]
MAAALNPTVRSIFSEIGLINRNNDIVNKDIIRKVAARSFLAILFIFNALFLFSKVISYVVAA